MAVSPNFEITHLIANVASPEIPLNTGLNLFDQCMGSQFTHDILSDADYTLVDTVGIEEWKYAAVKVTDTGVLLTATRNIIAPVNKKPYIFINGTAQSLVLKTSAGTGITVPTAKTQFLYCDGVNIIAVAAAV